MILSIILLRPNDNISIINLNQE